MPLNARQLEEQIAAFSRTLTPEAVYYWERHQPRYRYLLALVNDLQTRYSFDRILDVGMGFQTVLLSRLLPGSRVDCLGVEQDDRFRPDGDFTFHPADLNEVALQDPETWPVDANYDLIVFMEVLEHLYTPPDRVLRYLSSLLAKGGIIITTTPNAAWLKNRLKMILGRNPFELLKADRRDMGHIREYTRAELETVFTTVGLEKLRFERRGLYHFNNLKDNIYSRFADLTHPSLRRTLIAVHQKPA